MQIGRLKLFDSSDLTLNPDIYWQKFKKKKHALFSDFTVAVALMAEHNFFESHKQVPPFISAFVLPVRSLVRGMYFHGYTDKPSFW